MALHEALQTLSFVARGPVDQYRVLMADTAVDRGCVISDGTLPPIGVSYNDTREDDMGSHIGQAITVAHGGIVECIAGAPITPGVAVMANATGGVVPAAAGIAFGVSISTAAAGELVEVQWLGPWLAP